MIACKNLTFAYNAAKQFTFPDLQCNDRDALLILGQSGKGKTTLLHLMSLLLRPVSGQVYINNQDITPLSVAEAAALRAAQIGLVYQRPHFVGSLNVLDNLLLANYLANKTTNKQRATQLATQLGFAEHLSKKTNQLSQGEQQRVSIARALMNTPNVILADEPTSSLDDTNCENVIQLLKQQSEQIGASLVIVTHDQRLKDVFANQVML
ncbi:MAG: ATP-binding cassette domain-containing protein [Runella slithyformis]|nr:MAG: ATP-binding cassette domain-containing protein [Runella slithyformis]TAE94356.1 MAG: ATP-binding cassette domain-containing protein [Runella slithyformis]TAF28263.1 MAG: ATP-binding cassette domain-containing protein [Runella slithyformis]TAF46953.1 MAG: ATP-binding cassette domain-containing protein [Runella slithyformis]TAF83085.1 MAG: ATP-binding cassette domain-containing protein [Runella slithyformis]